MLVAMTTQTQQVGKQSLLHLLALVVVMAAQAKHCLVCSLTSKQESPFQMVIILAMNNLVAIMAKLNQSGAMVVVIVIAWRNGNKKDCFFD